MKTESRRDAESLGPDSLTWRYLGDWRYMLTASRWGALQSLDPAFGAGAVQHSVVFDEPLDRLMRSMPPIVGVVYDGPDAVGTARWIRDQHPEIKGLDHNGKSYHALNADTFFWAHATFVDCLVTMIDRFDHRLSDAEKEQIYAEGRQWWRMYGMSERPVPPDWPSFREYFDRYCEEVLEVNEGFTRAIVIAQNPAKAKQSYLPQWLYRLGSPLGAKFGHFLMVGLLPPSVRELCGYEWTAADERKLELFCAAVRRTWPLVPRRLRYVERARKAFDRVAKQAARS